MALFKSIYREIKWHFNLKACYYYIQVDGKNTSIRYFEKDLVGVI